MFSSGVVNEFVTNRTRMRAGEQIAMSSYRGSYAGERERKVRLQSGNQQRCTGLEAMAFAHAIDLENSIN